MALGARIRALRENQNLTQKALAEKLNIPHQNLSNYERGFRQPDYETLIKIADFFEVSTDYLLRGIDPKTQDKIYTEEAKKILSDPKSFIAARDGEVTDEIIQAALEIITEQLKERKKQSD
ncbi:helix-turn-helix domain-containing protein [Bacillus haynesii]|uniref:helix-turn-helix domain-containing protein n=1 Tax=Bacillus TaxID=1386 RepID=UPI0018A0B22C|nr:MULTISPECIES: helix-turn-helix domain-containing protein [Bacillus]MCY9215833.1 helix-turn-helix domain-containing protein [Bacillus haynesii]MCY9288110.1 helix-turn-helix domain-containing protein [Bacillus haynesii]UIN45107.1 helix-turn-helix domain-containing protein [Bacillus licheniformis]WIY55404.1 helix-turn-helix domain-containing protein [Bacillus licheniformis]